MAANERVYIAAATAADADRYHRHPDRCPPVAHVDLTEISVETARHNNCTLCANCNQIDKRTNAKGSGYATNGLARKLEEMNASDVLGGGPA